MAEGGLTLEKCLGGSLAFKKFPIGDGVQNFFCGEIVSLQDGEVPAGQSYVG